MKGIAKQILERMEHMQEGQVLSAKGLLHLGSRAAVDQALSRLCKSGKLLRVGRGLYAPPVHSRFGTRAPRPEKIVKGIASATGETIVPNGAVAANALGLTQQVPIRSVYRTSGSSRKVSLGKQVIELKHVSKRELQASRGIAGAAIRALAWMGPEHAASSAKTLRKRLAKEEIEALVSARAAMPTWLAETVSREFREESSRLH